MNFFQQISTLGVESLEIKIVNKKNTLSVSILPKSNSKTIETLKPIVITGVPEELDKEFFNIVSSPIEKTVSLISNIEEYEKSLEAVKAEKEEKKKVEATKTEKEEKKKVEAKKKEATKTEKSIDKVVEKPKEKLAPPSPYKKYEDAILEIVSVENFKIFRSNRTTLKDAVDKLLIMDKTNELGKKWEQVIKDFDEYASGIFYDDEEGFEVENKKTVAPPPPAETEETITESSEEFIENVVEENNDELNHIEDLSDISVKKSLKDELDDDSDLDLNNGTQNCIYLEE